MAKIISIHSFRGGTGKSNTTANIAVMLAAQGQRVAVIDTDIQSPGIHVIFGLEGKNITSSLNDYLWRQANIEDVALDVTPSSLAGLSDIATGKVFLVPSSTQAGEITRILREGYNAEQLTQGLRQLTQRLELDTLIIDTHPGLNQETLLSLVISHTLLIVMRPDQQDYEGTSITVKVARELAVPEMLLIVNKASPRLEPEAVRRNVAQSYGCPVVAVLPHTDAMMDLASGGIFAVRYPEHSMTEQYRHIAAQLSS